MLDTPLALQLVSVRIETGLWTRVREVALRERTSAQSIVTRALVAMLDGPPSTIASSASADPAIEDRPHVTQDAVPLRVCRRCQHPYDAHNRQGCYAACTCSLGRFRDAE